MLPRDETFASFIGATREGVGMRFGAGIIIGTIIGAIIIIWLIVQILQGIF